MEKELADILWENASQLDEAVVKLGDALDVKASIVLILATMLGTISGPALIMRGELPPWLKGVQAAAVLALAFAVIFALMVLWPVEFKLPPGIEGWENFLRETAEEHKDDIAPDAEHMVENVRAELRRSRLAAAKKRVAVNLRYALRKSKYNRYAYYASGLAILLDAATLMWMALKYM